MYVEAHEPSLYSRPLKRSLNYISKLNYCPTNPERNCVFEPQNAEVYDKCQFVTPPLGLRMLPYFESSGLDVDVVDDVSILDAAPWIISVPTDCFHLTH